MKKQTDIQVQEGQRPIKEKLKEKYTKTHINLTKIKFKENILKQQGKQNEKFPKVIPIKL